MATLDVIVGGQLTTLGGGTPFWRVSLNGVGMPEIKRIEDQGPLQHGATDVGFRLAPRMLQLVLMYAEATLAAAVAARDAFYALFTPSMEVISLRLTRDDGSVRQIDCHVVNAVDLPESEAIGASLRFVVQLRAAQPLWYDPQTYTAYVSGNGTIANLPIPFVVPLVASGSVMAESSAISYGGTFESFPTITVIGPVTALQITNESTGDFLSFAGEIPDGTTLTIDLGYGQKTVIDQGGVNRIGWLSNDSDLATFSLQAAPAVPGGTNSITVTGTDVDAGTRVSLSYIEWFVGV